MIRIKAHSMSIRIRISIYANTLNIFGYSIGLVTQSGQDDLPLEEQCSFSSLLTGGTLRFFGLCLKMLSLSEEVVPFVIGQVVFLADPFIESVIWTKQKM